MALSTTGFTTQSLSEIIDTINSSLLAIFPTLNTTELTEPEQQLVGVFAEVVSQINELAQNIYSGQNIDTAQGDSLDLLGNLLGVPRLQSAPTTVTATVTGTAATVIPAGTLFSVSGEPDIIVATDSDVTIPGGGSIDVACTATENGPKVINASTLTEIDTPVAGLTSVTNAASGTVGRNTETDSAYRIRLNNRKASSTSGTVAGIKESIFNTNVDGATTIVEHVTIMENDTGSVDSAGRPSHSFEAYVYQTCGATTLDSTIAQAILDSKGAGIESHGTVSETATDTNGTTRTIEFSRVDEIDIYCDIEVDVDSNYPVDGDDEIKTNIIAFGNAIGVGNDVIVSPDLVAVVGETNGIIGVTIKIGTAPSPTGSSNISIDDGTGGAVEISTWDAARVTVTSTVV